jgi:hypothetical protein
MRCHQRQQFFRFSASVRERFKREMAVLVEEGTKE